jgi:hypothetical protein
LKAAQAASKRALSTDKRVSSIEKSMREMRDLMASHFKSSATSAQGGAAAGIVSQADPPPPSVPPKRRKKVAVPSASALESCLCTHI